MTWVSLLLISFPKSVSPLPYKQEGLLKELFLLPRECESEREALAEAGGVRGQLFAVRSRVSEAHCRAASTQALCRRGRSIREERREKAYPDLS
jgi:hypothetical protein